MPDFYYVIQEDKTKKYLADTFYSLKWTQHLSKAKRFSEDLVKAATLRLAEDTHPLLVCVYVVNEADIVEVGNGENPID